MDEGTQSNAPGWYVYLEEQYPTGPYEGECWSSWLYHNSISGRPSGYSYFYTCGPFEDEASAALYRDWCADKFPIEIRGDDTIEIDEIEYDEYGEETGGEYTVTKQSYKAFFDREGVRALPVSPSPPPPPTEAQS